MFKLEVGPSAIKGVNVSHGVFNRGKFIPEGTLFGPYTGNVIPAEYEKVEKAGMESGTVVSTDGSFMELREEDNLTSAPSIINSDNDIRLVLSIIYCSFLYVN